MPVYQFFVQGRIRAGQMRQSMTLQTLTETADSQGSLTKTYTAAGTVRVSVRGMAGGETFQAGMISNPVTHILETRYRDDINPTCRLLWGTRTLEIMSVENIYSRNRKLQIIARELVT